MPGVRCKCTIRGTIGTPSLEKVRDIVYAIVNLNVLTSWNHHISLRRYEKWLSVLDCLVYYRNFLPSDAVTILHKPITFCEASAKKVRRDRIGNHC